MRTLGVATGFAAIVFAAVALFLLWGSNKKAAPKGGKRQRTV
jgi:hypothetical protein